MPNVVNANQYQIVADLLDRQEQAIEQLEELNQRVELAIKEVNAFRGVDEQEQDQEVELVMAAVSESLVDIEQSNRKAA